MYWEYIRDAYGRWLALLNAMTSRISLSRLPSGAGCGASGVSLLSDSGVAGLRTRAAAVAAGGSLAAGGGGSGLCGADVAAAARGGGADAAKGDAADADSDSASCRAGGGDSGGGAARANAAPGWAAAHHDVRLHRTGKAVCPVDALLPAAASGGGDGASAAARPAFALHAKLDIVQLTTSKLSEADALTPLLQRFRAPASLLVPSPGASAEERNAFASLVTKLSGMRRAAKVENAASSGRGSRDAYLLPPCAFAREQLKRLGAAEPPPSEPWLCVLLVKPEPKLGPPAAPQQPQPQQPPQQPAAPQLQLPAAPPLAPAVPPVVQQPQPPPVPQWFHVAAPVPPPMPPLPAWLAPPPPADPLHPIGFGISDDEDDAPAETDDQRWKREMAKMQADAAAPPLPPPPRLPPPPPPRQDGPGVADVVSLRAKAAAAVAEIDNARNPPAEDLSARTVLLQPPLPEALKTWSGGCGAASAAAAFFDAVVGGVVSAALDEGEAGAVRVCFERRALATGALRLRGELCGVQPLHLVRPPLQAPPPPRHHSHEAPQPQHQQRPLKRPRSPPRGSQQQPPWRGPWQR